MARFYADENFPLPVVAALRLAGHDVQTAIEAGQANAAVPDDAVLAVATADGRAVVTLNRRHFIRLHNTSDRHGGIVVCTFDPDHVGQAGRITAAVAPFATLDGRLVRVTRGDPQVITHG